MNPTALAPLSWDTDNNGSWTAYLGLNGLALFVMAETGGSAFILDSDEQGILNENVLGPTPDGWVDLGCYVRSINIQRGATDDAGVLTRYDAGTATIALDNNDLMFEPIDGAFGDRLNLGTTVVVMGRRRDTVEALAQNPEFNPWDFLFGLFKGTIADWVNTGYNDEDRIATFSLVDDTERLQQYDGLEQSPIGAGETCVERLNRILATAGWSTRTGSFGGQIFDEVLFPGPNEYNPTYQATTLAQPAWEMILRTADAASRSAFFSGTGRLVAAPISPTAYGEWDDYHWGCDEDGVLPLVGVESEYNKDELRNIIDAANPGGSQVTVTDETSTARYGEFRWGRNDLPLELATDVAAYAGLVLHWSSEPIPRVTGMRVDPTVWPPAQFEIDFERSTLVLVDLQSNAVAMVVGDSGSLTAGDQVIFDRLDATFDTVDVFDDSTPDDGTIAEATYAALIICDSVSSAAAGTKWLDWGNSVLVSGPLFAEHELADSDGGLDTVDVFIVPSPPPTWLSLTSGSYPLLASTDPGSVRFQEDFDIPGTANLAVQSPDQPNGDESWICWTFDIGDLRDDGSPAPARRAALGMRDATLAAGMSTAWFTMFDDLMAWLVPSVFVEQVQSTPMQRNVWDATLEFCDWLNGFLDFDRGHRHHIDVPIPGTDRRLTDTVALRGMRLHIDDSTFDLEFVTSTINQFLDTFILDSDEQGILSAGHRLS